MKRFITFTLGMILAIASIAHAETHEEMKARFENVRIECAERADRQLADYNPHFLVREYCRRIDSLRADLTQCANERNRRSACDDVTDYASLNQERLQRAIDLAHAYKNGWGALRDDAELREFGCNVIELIDMILQRRNCRQPRQGGK